MKLKIMLELYLKLASCSCEAIRSIKCSNFLVLELLAKFNRTAIITAIQICGLSCHGNSYEATCMQVHKIAAYYSMNNET